MGPVANQKRMTCLKGMKASRLLDVVKEWDHGPWDATVTAFKGSAGNQASMWWFSIFTACSSSIPKAIYIWWNWPIGHLFSISTLDENPSLVNHLVSKCLLLSFCITILINWQFLILYLPSQSTSWALYQYLFAYLLSSSGKAPQSQHV